MSGAPIVEPAICPDIFVTGAGPLQFIGDNLRLTLHVSQRSYDGSTENAVVAKLVGSRSGMLKIAAAILRGCHTQATPLDKVSEAFVEFMKGPAERH